MLDIINRHRVHRPQLKILYTAYDCCSILVNGLFASDGAPHINVEVLSLMLIIVKNGNHQVVAEGIQKCLMHSVLSQGTCQLR